MAVKPSDGDPGVLADRIVVTMTDLVGALGQLNDLIADRLGVGTTDLRCLHTLNREGPATAGTLGARLGRTTGAVTHMIDRLEKAGYVRRRPDPQDRRRVVVEAESAGLARIASFYEGIDIRSRDLMGAFTTEQLRTIQEFLAGSYEIAVQESAQLTGQDSHRG